MIQANDRTWAPKCGQTKAFIVMAVVAVISAVIFALAVHAFAQDATSTQPPFDWRGLLAAVMPALWAGAAPIAVKYLTWGINLAGTYVPRYVQVPVAGLLGAVASAWTGDVTTMASAIMAGSAAQTYAATSPSTMRSTAPPQPPPAEGQQS
jgi:hypothetical protein